MSETEHDAPVEEALPYADEDPFAAWPQPESGTVIEDPPEEGQAVQHVEGEIDVPDGYVVIEGNPSGRKRSVAIVVSRFNGGLTNRMLARALEQLEEAGVAPDAITVVPVPGAFELPLAAMALAKTRRYACVVALGAIVRGETPHFDYIASEAASGLQLAAIETGVPVSFGVLTVETVEQAEARIDKAAEAVSSALEMADVFAQLRASAAS
jgi:6,7-dimethyl-8-ribityllumazine synthase